MALDPDFRQDDGSSSRKRYHVGPRFRSLSQGRRDAHLRENTSPQMKRGCRGASLRPGNLQTWSAAGELQPGGPCVPPHPVTHALTGGGYPPRMSSDISGASPERTEPNSLLNHETSDHLLSLVEKTRPSLTATPMCAGRGCDTSLVLQKFSADPWRLSFRRFQPRQSSVTRSISAQAGTTSGGSPACWTTNRPRLNPIASSSESFGISAAAT